MNDDKEMREIYGSDAVNALAAVEAENKRRESERAFMNELVEKQARAKEKAEREWAEEDFGNRARANFFEANPTATEADYQRLLPTIKDEFLLANLRQRHAETATPEWFNAEFQ